jgi:hypothetical protein
MWHLEDLRFAYPILLGFAPLKLPQVLIYKLFLLTNIMLLFKFVLNKKSFEKTTVRTDLKQSCAVFFLEICWFAICEFFIKVADLRFPDWHT